MQHFQECLIDNALSLNSLFSFSRQKFAKDYRFKGETHEFIEVVCILDGQVGVTAGKDLYLLSAGEMVVHLSGEFHTIWSNLGTSPEAIIFSFRASPFPKLQKRTYHLSGEMIAELKEIFRAVEQTFLLDGHAVRAIKPLQEQNANLVLKRLELLLLKAFFFDEREETKYLGQSAENFARIISVMERKLDEPLCAEELATLCNMSVPTMERTVYRYSRCGAMRYYNHLKMKRAEKRLLEGESVKEVALSLGFSNQNYFSACYKKWCGIPPSQTKLKTNE